MLKSCFNCSKVFSVIFIVLIVCLDAKGQQLADSIRISIRFQAVTLELVLDQISEETGYSFSYNPRRIPLEQKVTIQASDRPLNEFLLDLGKLVNVKFELIEAQIVVKPVGKEVNEQKFTISGYVKDSGSGESLIGASIRVEQTGQGVISNSYGFYSISLPEGSYTIQYSFIGFEKVIQQVDLTQNHNINIDFVEYAPLLPEIVVESSKIRPLEEIQMSKTSLKPSEVMEIPALMSESDVIKSIQSLPGIKQHSDGSTFFYVRGGNKDQNLILVDEAPIYNPSHLLGFFSTVIPDAVKDIKIYKSDMPASQGGRLSSVIDIKTNDGNLKNFQAWGTLGLTSSKLAIEGPFKKDRSSFFLGGRFSRLKWLVKNIRPDIQDFNFYDLTGKINFKINDRNRFYASFYTGEDLYEVQTNSGINWTNTSGTLRWNHLFNEKLFGNFTFVASKYDYFLITDISKNEKWNSHISNATLKADFTHFKKPDNLISFGILIGGTNFNPGNLQSDSLDLINPAPIVSKKNADELAIYYEQERKLNQKWGIRYGLRLGTWTNRGESFEFIFNGNKQPEDTLYYPTGEPYNSYSYLEPRFNVSHFINETASLKLSFNHNVQNIHLISNSISPFTSLEVWLPSSINIKPQTADQLALGYYKFNPNIGVSFEIEGFYKFMKHQIDYVDHAQMLLNPVIESQLVFGNAWSYGIEFIARKEEGRIRGWFGYSLSSARKKFAEINSGRAFPAYYDRPHEASLVISYNLTPRIDLGINWNISSGSAFTSPTSFYYYDGQEVPVFTERNNQRFQTYHRMDLNAQFRLNKQIGNFEHSISISIFNVYGRRNAIFHNFNKTFSNDGNIVIPGNLFDTSRIYTQTYLYNIIPSIAYNFKFL